MGFQVILKYNDDCKMFSKEIISQVGPTTTEEQWQNIQKACCDEVRRIYPNEAESIMVSMVRGPNV